MDQEDGTSHRSGMFQLDVNYCNLPIPSLQLTTNLLNACAWSLSNN